MRGKNERLFLLLDILQRPGGASTLDILSRLDINRRTLNRYLDDLSAQGFDIEEKPDYYGNTNSKRWSISEKAYPQSFMLDLTAAERLLLRFSLARGTRFYNTELKDTVKKLESKVSAATLCNPKKRFSTTHMSFKGGKDYSGKGKIIEDLLSAIEKSFRLTVTYLAAHRKEAKTYDIEPYTLVDHGNALYCIVAVPHHNGDIRILAVDRIKNIKKLPVETFKVPANYSPQVYLNNSFGIFIEEPIQVRAFFNPTKAFYVRERIWGEDQKIEEKEDGSIILSFTAAGRTEIKRWLLSFGAEAELLEPASLVEEIAQEVAQMKNIYQKA